METAQVTTKVLASPRAKAETRCGSSHAVSVNVLLLTDVGRDRQFANGCDCPIFAIAVSLPSQATASIVRTPLVTCREDATSAPKLEPGFAADQIINTV